ncbi:sugar ABC transporter substrate-binding protein [Paenibacillus sp. J31TS4]|uniref:ABC transporter substrate-binding protein n=1 Tax=Paenibacillus sp. J31TS4 TaxID=2807195 RepID=UPI001B2B5426|nr:sugar ABC transporter substrate-binding protein [Paenibacillus sp. J31TS4]GIP39456.1 sugar ABC transporter substrate-binding protein [Paenibacillus sp. J31TS4]
MKQRTGLRTCGLFVLIVLLALSGCSSRSSEGGSGKVTLNLALWDENLKDVIQKTVAAYEAKHPNVQVNVTYTPFADYWSKLRTSLAGKGGPDVFWMNGPNFYQYVNSGLLKDLQPLVERDKFPVDQYTETLVDMYTYDKHLYGVPYFQDVIGLFYNKELFDRKKLPYPDETWTWDDMKAAAEKLTDKENGIYGMVAPAANQDGYYNFIHQAGGYMISEDKTKSGFDLPETKQALTWVKQAMDAGISPTAQQQLETEPMQLFGSGKAAMLPGISVKAAQLHELLGDKLAVAPLPAGKQKATIVHGLSWAMNKKTAHEQEAWELIQELTGEAGNKLVADSGFSIPAYKGTEGGWLRSLPSLNLQVFVDSLKFGVPYPISKSTIEWQDVETKEIQKAFMGKTTIDEAADKTARRMNEILAKEREG